MVSLPMDWSDSAPAWRTVFAKGKAVKCVVLSLRHRSLGRTDRARPPEGQTVALLGWLLVFSAVCGVTTQWAVGVVIRWGAGQLPILLFCRGCDVQVLPRTCTLQTGVRLPSSSLPPPPPSLLSALAAWRGVDGQIEPCSVGFVRPRRLSLFVQDLATKVKPCVSWDRTTHVMLVKWVAGVASFGGCSATLPYGSTVRGITLWLHHSGVALGDTAVTAWYETCGDHA